MAVYFMLVSRLSATILYFLIFEFYKSNRYSRIGRVLYALAKNNSANVDTVDRDIDFWFTDSR